MNIYKEMYLTLMSATCHTLDQIGEGDLVKAKPLSLMHT